MKKYIIAYAPCFDHTVFTSLVEEQRGHSKSYCIGIGSAPHVTISQFLINPEDLEEVWDSVCSEIENPFIELEFKKYSQVTFDGSIHWLSLIPEQTEELFEGHFIANKHIEPIRKDAYDPHLTLFNFLIENFQTDVEALERGVEIKGDFQLVLGECDPVGQLTNVIATYNNKSSKLQFK